MQLKPTLLLYSFFIPGGIKFPLQPLASHSMKNVAFHSSPRWKMIILPILVWNVIRLLAPFPHGGVGEWGEETDDISDYTNSHQPGGLGIIIGGSWWGDSVPGLKVKFWPQLENSLFPFASSLCQHEFTVSLCKRLSPLLVSDIETRHATSPSGLLAKRP